MGRIISTRIQNKRDTSSNWASHNPKLLNGEMAIVRMDSGETRIKFGDGQKNYNSLPFADEYIRNLLGEYTVSISSDVKEGGCDEGQWGFSSESFQDGSYDYDSIAKFCTFVTLAAAGKTGKHPIMKIEDADGKTWEGTNLLIDGKIYLFSQFPMSGRLVVQI